ncbi:DUF294 nucleotidyltransferase-like domain-containing protein [Chitinibacteraceae bacterium HSL-7]
MATLFNFAQPPFDYLDSSERTRIERALEVEYFPAGNTVQAADDPVERLFVIIKGQISEMAGDTVIAHYREHDTLDVKALATGIASQTMVAVEDCVAFVLPRRLVLDLTRANPMFGAYFYQSIAKRMAALAQRPQQQELNSLVSAKVRQACVSPPYWQDENTTVLEAARVMQREHVTSVLVRSARGTGIFTQSDLRNFVIAGGDAATAPLGWHAVYDLKTVDEDDDLFQAMLLMARHTIQRVVVMREHEVVGVLEQIELLAFLSNHSHLVQLQIERASSLADLKVASLQIDRLISQLDANGAQIPMMGELVRELHAKMLERMFELVYPPEVQAQSCLLLLGSEGRGEQLLKTDQDNALVLDDDTGLDDPAEASARFNDAMMAVGYPPCPGDIMVRNPEWRGSVSDFRQRIASWIDTPSPEHMMTLAIWFDAYPAAGRRDLIDTLRAFLFEHASHHRVLLAHFARPVTQFGPPAGAPEQVDLKKHGIFVIVHGVRALALEHQLAARNSYLRLSALTQRGVLDPALGQEVQAALAHLQQLALRNALKGLPHYELDIRTLSKLDRDLLKDAFDVVRRFRHFVVHHFRLDQL